MRDKNKYTIFLAGIGLIWTVVSVLKLSLHDNPLEMIAIILLISLLLASPIKLPNQFYYTFDTIPSAYLMLKYEWTYAIFPSIIGLLFLHYQTRVGPPNWFRLFVNLGMYCIAIGIGYLAIQQLGLHINIFVVLLLFSIIDLVSYALKKGIQISVLGAPVLIKPSFSDLFSWTTFVVVSSIFTSHLYQADTMLELVQEVIFTALLLYIFSRVSKKYVDQMQINEESRLSYEMCLDNTDQVFITMDKNGKIEAFNSITEHLLGYSKNDIIGSSIWDFVKETTITQEAFSRAAKGLPEHIIIKFKLQDGDLTRLKGALVPCTRNKKVAGVYFIGQTIEAEVY
jgi:PAS domain S-box-containing protein